MNTVLLVQPRDDGSVVLPCVLKSDAWETVRVKSTQDAIPYLANKDLEFIVVDSGSEAFEREAVGTLKYVRDDVPIIVLTRTPALKRISETFPVVAVLEKPLDGVDLIMEVHAAVKTATAIRRLRAVSQELKTMAPRA